MISIRIDKIQLSLKGIDSETARILAESLGEEIITELARSEKLLLSNVEGQGQSRGSNVDLGVLRIPEGVTADGLRKHIVSAVGKYVKSTYLAETPEDRRMKRERSA